MNYRDALVIAIDALRGSGIEDPQVLKCAKTLERKHSRLRARQEPKLGTEDYCTCGDRKRRAVSFCELCYAAFPMALVMRFHSGRRKESAAALRSMVVISQTRIQSALQREAA